MTIAALIRTTLQGTPDSVQAAAQLQQQIHFNVKKKYRERQSGEADDIAQDVLCNILNRKTQLTALPDDECQRYAMAILHNTINDHLRKQQQIDLVRDALRDAETPVFAADKTHNANDPQTQRRERRARYIRDIQSALGPDTPAHNAEQQQILADAQALIRRIYEHLKANRPKRYWSSLEQTWRISQNLLFTETSMHHVLLRENLLAPDADENTRIRARDAAYKNQLRFRNDMATAIDEMQTNNALSPDDAQLARRYILRFKRKASCQTSPAPSVTPIGRAK